MSREAGAPEPRERPAGVWRALGCGLSARVHRGARGPGPGSCAAETRGGGPGAVPTSAWTQRRRGPRAAGRRPGPAERAPRRDTLVLRRTGPPALPRLAASGAPRGTLPCCSGTCLVTFQPRQCRDGRHLEQEWLHIRNLCSDSCPLLPVAHTLPREGEETGGPGAGPRGLGGGWGRPGLPPQTSSPQCSRGHPDGHPA